MNVANTSNGLRRRSALRPRMLVLAAGAAMSLCGLAGEAKAQWANNVNGTTLNWSNPASWTVVPVSNPNSLLTFTYNFGSTAQVSQNDIAGLFDCNRITLNNESAGGFTISALAPSTGIQFNTNTSTSVAPQLINNSSIAATISAPISITGTNNLRIQNTAGAGNGNGNLTLSGVISDNASSPTLGLTFLMTGPGVTILSGVNTFTGNSTITSGNVGIGNNAAFGAPTNTVTIGGGTLRFTTTGLSVGQNFTLNSSLNLTGAITTGANTSTFTGVLSGPGGINVKPTGDGTFVFQGNNTFAGAYTAQQFGNANFTTVGSTQATLSGANGAFSNVSAINLIASQTILLDNSTANNPNRLNDAAPISMNRATLQLTGNAAGSTESVGAITFTGSNGLAAVPNAAGSAVLTAASVSRSQRGSLVVTGTNLGGSGANSSRVISTLSLAPDLVGGGGAAGSTNISILPYAYAATTVGGTATAQLTTYDNTVGFRPLTPSEYVDSFLSQGTNTSNNIRSVSGNPRLLGSTTANAFAIDSPSSAIGSSVYGSGSLTLTGGQLLFSVTGGTASTIPAMFAGSSLNFGTREALIHSQNASAIPSVITGSNGLTKAGAGQLILNGANTFTGDVTINAGIIAGASDSIFGNAANNIVLTGGNGSGFTFAPSNFFDSPAVQSLTIARNVTLGPAGGGFQATLANTTLTLTGVISGPGQLVIGNNNAANIGTVKLSGINTYSGPTVIFGDAAIDSDANLGTNTDVVMTAGYLRADGPFTTSRNFTFTGIPAAGAIACNLMTNGFDMTISGTLSTQSGGQPLVKLGTNSLTLTANSPFNGTLTIGQSTPLGDQDHLFQGGSVILSGAGALPSVTAASLLSGTSLILDNAAGANSNNRFNGNVTLGGSTLEYRGNAVLSSTETIGTITAANGTIQNGTGIVNIVPGAGNTVLTASNFVRSAQTATQVAGSLLVRSPNLGGAIGAGTGNLVFNTAPALTNNIIPGVVGDTLPVGNGSGFTTHAAGTGVRLLNAGEYSLNTFGATNNVDVVGPQVLAGATAANAVRISATGGITQGAADTLTVGTGMVLVNGINTGISGGTLAFGTAPGLIWNNNDLAVSSTITGTGGLQKAGPGNLTLNTATGLTVSGANTTLPVNISNGRVTYGVAGALPAATALQLGTTDGASGTLDLNGFNTTLTSIGGVGTVNLNGANLALTGGSTFGGSIVGNGNLTVSGSTTLSGVSSFVGDITVRGATTGLVTLTIAGNQPAVGNGPAGAGGNIILGDGTTGGGISFGSNVRFFNRNIIVPASTAAFQSAAEPTINQNTGSNTIVNGNITVSTVLGLGNGGGANTTASPFTNSLTLAGNISDGTAPGSLDWELGNFNLWGNNTFTGGVVLNPGPAGNVSNTTIFLGIGTNTALGTGKVRIFNFVAGNLRADFGARTLANDFYFSDPTNGSPIGFAGVNDMTITGKFDLGGGDLVSATPPSVAGARSIQTTSTGVTTLAGVVSGAATSTLSKLGGGVLVMLANNTFQGNVTVAAGSLIVNGTNSGAGSYTVQSGALLGGNGTIAGPITVNGGGILSPGASPGTLRTGAANLSANGGIWDYELALPGSLSPDNFPPGSDLLIVNGTLTLPTGTNLVTIRVTQLAGFGQGWYKLIDYGTNPLVGNVLLSNGGSFKIVGLPDFWDAHVDTASRPGLVLLQVIPAPSSVALLGIGGLLAARRRRRA